MAPKSLAEQIAELDDLTPRDFDPEDLDRGAQDSDDEDVQVDADAGREHYQDVGKAKLRKEDPISLGKQYAGSRVSRDALEAESDDDPFAVPSGDEDEDEEGSEESEEDEELESGGEDDMEEESEEEKPRKSKKLQKKTQKEADLDDMDTDESEDVEADESLVDFDADRFSDLDDDSEDSEDSEDDDEEEEGDSEDDDEEESEEESAPKRRVKFDKGSKTDDREELRQLMATDQKTIAATISQAAKADATKGKAVKQQRATFDALLNTRIKLQKGLTAINQLSIAAQDPTTVDGEAIKSAETAALTLWSTLEDLRLALADAQQSQDAADGSSKKRKRPSSAAVSPTTSSASLWKRMVDLESDSVAHRRAVLDKWSLKVRGSNANLPNARGKLLGSSGGQQTITAVLDAHVASETGHRATKRARSDAGADGKEPLVYDDAIFYQSLLRDLVEQRMSSSDAITNGLDTLHLLPSKDVHPVTGMRKDKVKKEIDTRASKGRKMKYDVQEKLQNFMAPEDRGVWTSHAREEFFASLLGKTASGLLREEDEEDGASEAGDSDEDREEGGLKLFRS